MHVTVVIGEMSIPSTRWGTKRRERGRREERGGGRRGTKINPIQWQAAATLLLTATAVATEVVEEVVAVDRCLQEEKRPRRLTEATILTPLITLLLPLPSHQLTPSLPP